KIPLQETRGWSESQNGTFSQRVKEEANDYRYFPEPDIPPLTFSKEQISSLRNRVPELQADKIARFVKEFGLKEADAEIITRDKELSSYFEAAVQLGSDQNVSPKQIANAIINKKIDYSSTTVEKLLSNIAESSRVDTLDETELQTIIDKVFSENEQAVADYKSGKETVIMFLVGQTMRALGKKVDIQQVKSQLEKSLQK
ncbi:MAG TPA: hypothetical protein VG935_02820, partial [Patescibacteria group bacterium]|nr:hypothetical protein [Patescibacteria group bacterium]